MDFERSRAQEEVYRRYKDRIYTYIRYRVNHEEDAEDLQANVFTKVFQKWDEYDQRRAKISTWIYTIARNEVIDFYRTHKEHEEVPEELRFEGEIEEEYLTKETLAELARALLMLDQLERDVVVLHYYEGLTFRQIAKDMAISYDRTKHAHYRALKKLRGLIGQG